MTNTRLLWMGLGIGLIVSSLIFSVLGPKPAADLDLQTIAVQKGFVLVPQTEYDTLKEQATKSDSKGEQSTPKQENPVEVVIQEGMTSSEIADLLLKKGVISDVKEFMKEYESQGLKPIHIGTYHFTLKEPLVNIVKVITNVKQ